MVALLRTLLGISVAPDAIEVTPVVERPSPFGYKPSVTPATTERRYNSGVIGEYVRSHVILPEDDALAQTNAEYLYEIYADFIAHLPPYRQVLTLDGDRPCGWERELYLGESYLISGRRGMNGIYDFFADCVAIRVQEFTDDTEAQETTPALRSKASIQGSISHETAHQQDNQITQIKNSNDAWSLQSKGWKTAIQQEIESGNVGQYLQTLLPETEIVLHKPYYQYPPEAKAEFEKLFCLAYSKLGGDFEATSEAMGTAYPYMWPVFRNEYLAEAYRIAAWVNPHIDLHAKPVGFDDMALEALPANLFAIVARPPIDGSVVGHAAP